jgi:hypothetical protein
VCNVVVVGCQQRKGDDCIYVYLACTAEFCMHREVRIRRMAGGEVASGRRTRGEEKLSSCGRMARLANTLQEPKDVTEEWQDMRRKSSL